MTSRDEVVETRPTGAFGGTQDWHYCFECWISMEQVRQWDLDLELLYKTVFTGLEEKETALPWLGTVLWQRFARQPTDSSQGCEL